MSKRSGGVTQFFRISMILHARRQKNPANSYIYLFDEPGVFLHPRGQTDLLQVLEGLADESQIVYATHSLFMLNQNFPERHRLILKDEDGTKVDQKPYRANWRWATDALGVFLTSNILFSSRVLLVEGDSDPIYIFEMLRQLNQSGQIDADSNTLGIFSFYDYQNLRFLLQVFTREGQKSKVLVLVDGDSQGKVTIEKIKPLCDRLGVKSVSLDKGRSIEDYCLLKDSLLKAAVSTLQVALNAEDLPIPPDLADRVDASWRENLNSNQRKSAGKWFNDFSKDVLNGDSASKVGLARNYVFLAREMKDVSGIQPEDSRNAKGICGTITTELDLPRIRAKETITG
jgi:predicted ATP-dependent endonuclease of OLD family